MALPLLHVIYTPDSPLYFVRVCLDLIILIVSSLPLCVSACRMLGCILGLLVSVMKLVFVYCILGYRVYRIGITIKIITPSLPPDTVTTYSCILTTKNIQKNFQKMLAILFSLCYTYASSNETHKTK